MSKMTGNTIWWVMQGPVVCARTMEVEALNENSNSRWNLRYIIGVDCCYLGSRISSDG